MAVCSISSLASCPALCPAVRSKQTLSKRVPPGALAPQPHMSIVRGARLSAQSPALTQLQRAAPGYADLSRLVHESSSLSGPGCRRQLGAAVVRAADNSGKGTMARLITSMANGAPGAVPLALWPQVVPGINNYYLWGERPLPFMMASGPPILVPTGMPAYNFVSFSHQEAAAFLRRLVVSGPPGLTPQVEGQAAVARAMQRTFRGRPDLANAFRLCSEIVAANQLRSTLEWNARRKARNHILTTYLTDNGSPSYITDVNVVSQAAKDQAIQQSAPITTGGTLDMLDLVCAQAWAAIIAATCAPPAPGGDPVSSQSARFRDVLTVLVFVGRRRADAPLSGDSGAPIIGPIWS